MITNRKITDDYVLGRFLGEGAYAQVRLGKNKKTGVSEVVKKIPIGYGDEELLGQINNEIETLM